MRLYKECGSNSGETPVKYAHDGMNAVLEFDSDMNLQYKYVYANGVLLGRVDASDQEAYYHHDGLGTVLGLTDATPAVTKSYLYDEFGTAIGIWGDAVNTYKYTGQETEGGPTDGYNLRAREYYTSMGRFMQNDPIGDGGGSANWYLYVANNPVNATDLSGLKSYLCIFAGAGLIPGHQYFKIVNSKVGTYTAGYHPVGGWAEGRRTVSDPNLMLPGEVRHDESGGMCLKISDDECFDDLLIKAIDKATKENHQYNFRRFNCDHWIKRVISILGE